MTDDAIDRPAPKQHANRDPITDAPGAHPLGVAAGAAGTGAAGAAIGAAVAGPVGAIIGAAVGAVTGGMAGKAAAELVNPTVETEYWREAYRTQPYAKADVGYQEYEPAYRYGWESWQAYAGRTYEDVETELERGWEGARGPSKLAWNDARQAARDAWARVERTAPRGATPEETRPASDHHRIL